MSTHFTILAIGLLAAVTATNNPSAPLMRREDKPASDLQQAATAQSATYHCHKGPKGKCWSFSYSLADSMYHAAGGRHKNEKTFRGDSMENAKDWCINAHGNEYYDVPLEELFGEGPCPVSAIAKISHEFFYQRAKPFNNSKSAWPHGGRAKWRTNDAPIFQSAILMDRSGKIQRTAKGQLVATARMADRNVKKVNELYDGFEKEQSWVDQVLKMKPGDKQLKWDSH